jgi:ABC-type multidrug transport system fused ATPase/permease subunit
VLILVRAGTYGQQSQASVQVLRQAQPYVERIQEAQRRYTENRQTTGTRNLNEVESLAFAQVGFTYGRGRPALADVDFTVEGGEAVGIIGPSGAGKSTMVQILLGLRPPGSGTYLVNGVPADEFDRVQWRTRFAYVPQDPRLLHAPVRDNIRFFRDIDDASIERAARLAGIHDEVMQWPAGYNTIVGPRADAISGGQQQRICLARALAARPEVLVLDEPTSALDPRAEQLIQESLRSLKHQLTLFVVAHRMSTLDICERVMVIVDGRLDAFARIAELQTSNEYYRSAVSGRTTTSAMSPNG